MSNDTKFITNEGENTLENRFNIITKDAVNFDVLVGYFYSSGFYKIYKALENTKKIRILVGISTDNKTFGLFKESQYLSHAETKKEYFKKLKSEMDNSEDSLDVFNGVIKFIEWLQNGKLEIKAHKDENVHAKLYISTFSKEDRDTGRVITGSSNLTVSGLKKNLEFNVELKDNPDHEFALKKFNELWENAVDLSEVHIETIKKETWLNEDINPYELFLKFLYEYFKEEINLDQEEIEFPDRPDNFVELKYQSDAVIDAEKKLNKYGGVFLSDVVGLGKTYMAALLAKKIKGKTLVIAPPALLKWNNPGSWNNAMYDFNVPYVAESKGKLDKILNDGIKYDNVIIDEAHEFRNEDTQGYEKLHRICQGKRVILVSATPYNNKPLDILSLIKLFQPAHKSQLPDPEVRDLQSYFTNIQKQLDISKNRDEKETYLKLVKETSNDIREKVLKHLMVRRTRTSVNKYYAKDLEKQGLKFPDVQDPVPVVYELDDKLDNIFNVTLELIVYFLKYSRYTPLLYLKDFDEIQKIKAPQINMGRFMKTLLLKRLESSFYAFKKSIDRFIYAYEKFIEAYESGYVYISKKKIDKIYKYLDEENDELIDALIETGDAEKYSSDEFNEDLYLDLKEDLKTIKKIKNLWKDVDHDPKLDKFKEILKKDKNLKKKVIVFTESEETMNYLKDSLNPLFDYKIFSFSGSSNENDKRIVINNFDGNARHLQGTAPPLNEEYRILIATEVLSQGMNLHQSNVVINYDIPWNPTRMMQRVGRVQRVDTKFDEIFIYNFFPANKISENLPLRKAVESKLTAFIEMLGNDSKLLTDEEIKSHDLFVKLTSKETVLGEEEEDPELEYLNFIREVRDNDEELFTKIKKLPKKARTGRKTDELTIKGNGLVTFFRKGSLTKIYLNNTKDIIDLDFENAIYLLKSDENTEKEEIPKNYFNLLKKNKLEFENYFKKDKDMAKTKLGTHQKKLKEFLLAIKGFYKLGEDERDFCVKVIDLIDNGSIPKKTAKIIVDKIKKLKEPDLFKIYLTIRDNIDSSYFEYTSRLQELEQPKEIILSEYLIKGD